MDRRKFSQQLMASLLSYALFDTLFAHQAFGKPIQPITRHWANRLNEYCADLRKSSIRPVEWQQLVEGLYQKIGLEEILRFIDFEKLIKGFSFPNLGVNTRPVHFPQLEGLPEKTAFVKKIFGMKKDRAIIPHGHSNMASAHLVLKGEMHLRHYDKIREEDNHLIIQPGIDKITKAGDCSSISDEKDNIHWFIAHSESAFTFDVIVLDLQGQPYDIHNLDIYAQEKQADGTLRVPTLDVETALRKYGKETHH